MVKTTCICDGCGKDINQFGFVLSYYLTPYDRTELIYRQHRKQRSSDLKTEIHLCKDCFNKIRSRNFLRRD